MESLMIAFELNCSVDVAASHNCVSSKMSAIAVS